ncbi:MAG: hypothetical protein PUG67_09020 [Peptoniphilaceae bacterium]|nr:hypothetical protein [Peptoniphilaceae bacterium]MDY6018537.1 hypothetical protein [Anaerococcus sp.]
MRWKKLTKSSNSSSVKAHWYMLVFKRIILKIKRSLVVKLDKEPIKIENL